MANSSFIAQSKVAKFTYTWTIDGYPGKERLCPKEYAEKFPRRMTWQLKIIPSYNTHWNNNHNGLACHYPYPQHILSNPLQNIQNIRVNENDRFGIHLKYAECNTVCSIVEFSILKPDGSQIFQEVKSADFSVGETVWFKCNSRLLMMNTCPIIFIDRFNVRVEIFIYNNYGSNLAKSNDLMKIGELKVLQDLSQLLENGSLSDVTLTVGSKSFRGHKAILTARSPVFAAMFQHDMLESKNNVVTITDIEPEVFQEVLRFIYTGAVGSSTVMDTMALELLTAADKYALIELQKVCAEHLTQSLTVETAAEALIMAELFDVADLKTRAIDFIKRHTAKVTLTSGWFKLAAYPALRKELATKLK